MPRNNKKTKQRALDLESNEDTVISNLAANEDNSTQMDRLKNLHEMFANKIDPDLIQDVFHECAGNAEKTSEKLLEMFDSNPYDPCIDWNEMQFEEVPDYLAQEVPPLNISTNSNTEYMTRSITDPKVEVLNKLPINAKSTSVSPLNAVMPFAFLFSPKNHISFNAYNGCPKSSQLSKPKEIGVLEKVWSALHSNKKVLILMRGLPGSGKSWCAHNLVNKYNSDKSSKGMLNGVVLSTDDYFLNNGVYRFDATQLPEAHNWNHKRAQTFIKSGKTLIVIDNTNLEGWEMQPYVSFGFKSGYTIFFMEPDTPWKSNARECSKHSVHRVPKDKIEIMAQRFQRLSVEDMIRSLSPNSQSVQRSTSEEKIPKNIISTNGLKQIVLRSSSSPSAAISSAISASNDSDYAESPKSSQTSVSAQIEDMTNNSQVESSSSPVSTEPTSPMNESQIDIDLLLALNQRSADSEDCSSINASDASSQVSQESGWERDDEFTYAHNTQQTVDECNDGHKPSGSGVNGIKNDNKLIPEFEPKPQREHKTREELKVSQLAIEEENLKENAEFNEPWDELNESNNSKGQSNSTAPETPNNKLKKFSLVGVRKNWEFPAFPVDHSNDLDSNEREISITCYTRQTQTERLDWALLELKQSNEDSNEGLETQSNEIQEKTIETKVFPSRNLLKVMLHKGTVTTDIPNDLTRDQKLSTLRLKFPKAEDNHLNNILDACLEDDKWAEKLLSELDDNHFDVGNLEQLSTSSEPSVSSPELDSESISTEDEEPFELLSDPKNSDEPEFVLTLDPLLAAQLQSHFGCITDSLTEDDLTLTLSHGVARLLHHNWKKSLNQKPSNHSSNAITAKIQTQSITNNNNNNKSKRGAKDKQKKAFEGLHQNAPKSELQEIMDLEMAKALSRQEYDESLASDAINSLCPSKRQMAKDLLSTKMKRNQLFQRYPGVDQSFLDTIFESNDYFLGKTIDVLDNSLGLSDDFSKETEALIADEGFGSPMGGSSRAASPSKPIRKTIDVQSVLSKMNSNLEKKKEYHNKARLAYQRKMYAVASYYGDEASTLQREIDRLSADIVDSILNDRTNSNQLDLHGLHLKEVNSILSEYLRRKTEELRKTAGKRKLVIDIITGYGATKGIQGSIKPTVILYLKQKGFQYEMLNMGVIRVTLTQ